MILKRFIPPHTPSSGTQSTSPESWVRKPAAAWNLKQAGSAGKEASPSSRALVSPVDYLLKESLKSLFRSRKQSFDPVRRRSICLPDRTLRTKVLLATDMMISMNVGILTFSQV